jgi:Fic family protein
MVVNNYLTMHHIRQDLDVPLSVATITEIHRQVTEDTLDNPRDAGRILEPGEKRVDVGDPIDPALVFHHPPDAAALPGLLDQLSEFANAVDSEPFIHPVVRAMALHFYLSYVHPFTDGNGRT